MLRLVLPQEVDKEKVMSFRQEFLDCNERISGGVGLEKAESYEQWLRGETIPHYGKVKEMVFLAEDEQGEIVGVSDIRMEENDFIRNFAGQIGYSIRPSRRGKGYATQLLHLTLQQAQKQGFPQVLVTCNQPNQASARVIEKNGGVLQEVVAHPGYPDVRRYLIYLHQISQG